MLKVKIRAGASFDYNINVSGEPPPEKKWTLKGKEVRTNDHVRVTAEDYNIKLVVKSSRREDTGTYTLTAENVNGKDSATVEVIILGKFIKIIQFFIYYINSPHKTLKRYNAGKYSFY